MAAFELNTEIEAPIAVVFDLARSIDLHVESAEETREKAIAGRTSGLIDEGETVTWKAVHFGLTFQLQSEITEMCPPHYFRDEMLHGPFRHLVHHHYFEQRGTVTMLKDRFEFSSPGGPLGRLVDWLVMENHLRTFLQRRNEVIKEVATSKRQFEFLDRAPKNHLRTGDE